MTDLVDLAHAHVTQLTTKGKKGPWVVKANGTEEVLGEFPPHLTEAVVFEILHFARKFELIALNAGIEFQKDKQNSVLHEANQLLVDELNAMKAHSDKLADKLDQLTKGNA